MKQTLSSGYFLRLVSAFLLSTLVPLGLGVWLDRRLGTGPLFLLVCASIGIVASSISIVRIATRALAVLGTPSEAGILSRSPTEAVSRPPSPAAGGSPETCATGRRTGPRTELANPVAGEEDRA